MKIYFAGAIRGGRRHQPVYAAIIDHLSQHHDVLTVHVAAENVDEEEGTLTDEQIYQRDIAWLDQAEIMIAGVTVPSIGVGYEIAYARSLGKDVICIAHESAHISAMIMGDSRLRTVSYTDAQDAIAILDRLLSGP